MNRLVLVAMFLISTSPLFAQKEVMVTMNKMWDDILKRHTVNGYVDYRAMVTDGQLKEYMGRLNLVTMTGVGKKDRLAFLLNVYNASIVNLVAENYPIKSINDIKVNAKSVFDHKCVSINKRSYSLNEVEHELIRNVYMEPRVHFALNAAAKSSPKLSATAFTSENLENQLDTLTREFINDPAYNTLDFVNLELKLNKAFEWYIEDFGGNQSGIIDFISKFVSETDANVLKNQAFKVTFIDYDWGLNDIRQ